MFDSYGYLMDPHTAVAQYVYEQYNKLHGYGYANHPGSNGQPV